VDMKSQDRQGIISEGRQEVCRTFLQLLQIFRYDKR
jgi:hypothetical protein